MGADKGTERSGNVTTGLILITLGVVYLAATFDVISWKSIWRYWPLALIVIGMVHLLLDRGPARIGNASLNILLGVVFLAITLRWMDLDWGTGWPLILVAIGLSSVLRAVSGWGNHRRRPPGSGAAVVEEERHA